MKNEEDEHNALIQPSNPNSQPANSGNQPNQQSVDPESLFSSHFLESYNKLLCVNDKIKKEKIIKVLQTGGIEYYPTQNSNYFQLNLIRSTQNLNAITVKCYMGPFATVLNIYRTNNRSIIHFHSCLYGNSGNVYLFQLQGQSLAVKCIQINKKQSSQIAESKFVLRAIKQYFFAKIASVLRIGPKLIRYQEFDLILYGNCIQFWMEQCRLIEDQHQKFRYKCQLTQMLRVLHQIFIVHCDIKDQNIAFSGAYNKPVFIDFGATKVLNRGPGFKFHTYFFGTLNYCSKQMGDLYISKSKGFVDLYFNDAHCFGKIYKEGQNRSTRTPIQNILKFQRERYYGFDAIKIQYHLYENSLQNIKKLENGKQYDLNILSFLQQLMPNEDLRRFYHQNYFVTWAQSSRFQKLNRIYKFNKECHFQIPQNNGSLKKNQPDFEDWSLSIFNIYLQRVINFDQLDSFQQQQITKTNKTKTTYNSKMKDFLTKITVTSSSSLIQPYIQYKNKIKSNDIEQPTLVDYLNYLNQTLKEDMSKSDNFAIRRIKDILKKKALIEPYTHQERLELINHAKSIHNKDFLIEIIQCRLLEYSFWDGLSNNSFEEKGQTIKISDYSKIIKASFKEVTQQVVNFYIAMISIFVYGESQQLQLIKKMCLVKDEVKSGRKRLCELAKLKILIDKKCYIQAKKILFANKSQFDKFKGLNFWHFFLFKLVHEQGQFETSKKILQFIDFQIQKIGDQSLIKNYFKKEREIYNFGSALQFASQNVMSQMNSLRTINQFVSNFLILLKEQEEARWNTSPLVQGQKSNLIIIRNVMFFLQDLEILQFPQNKKKIYRSDNGQIAVQPKSEIESDESAVLRELKLSQQSYIYLRFLLNEGQGNILDSQLIMQRVMIQNKYLSLKHIDILDSILKVFKFCKDEKYITLEQKLYERIITEDSQTNFLKEKVNSFTYMFILNYAFQTKNFKLFQNLFMHLLCFVDANPSKKNINRYVLCLRYLFTAEMEGPELTFINSIINSLDFDRYPWKYSYSGLFRFEFAQKLAKILDEKSLKCQIFRASRFLPCLSINCVNWAQKILYPLVLNWDFTSNQRLQRLKKFILRKARKNTRFYAHLTKNSYEISQVWIGSYDFFESQNKKQDHRFSNFLNFYANQLENNSSFFHCKGIKRTKIGSFGHRKQIRNIFRQKLSKYHQNCKNRTFKSVKQQKKYLFRLAIQ